MALYQMERYSDAIAEFNEELAEDPECCVTFAMRGASLFNLGYLRNAEEDIQHSLSLEPEYSYSYFILSLIKERQDRPRDAEKAILEALRLGPEPRYFRQLADILAEQGRVNEALQASKRALELDPTDEMSLIAHGRFLSAIGESEEADALLKEARAKRPDLADTHFAIGMFDLNNRKTGAPIESLLEARRLAPMEFNDAEPIALAVIRELWPFRLLQSVTPWWLGWTRDKRWLLAAGTCTFGLVISWGRWFEAGRWVNWALGSFLIMINLLTIPVTMLVVADISAKHFESHAPSLSRALYWRVMATCILVLAFYVWIVTKLARFFLSFPSMLFLVLAGLTTWRFFQAFLRMETLVSGLKNLFFGLLFLVPAIAGVVASVQDIKLGSLIWILLLICSYFSNRIFAWLNRPRGLMKFPT